MRKSNSQKSRYALSPKPFATGGQAEIFLANHRQTGQEVAFKRLIDSDNESIARMRREIEVQTDVSHRHVMPILDYSTSYRWYTMPKAIRTLADMTNPIAFDELVEIIKACAEGLRAAHNMGFIHRDLSPNNILEICTDNDTRWVVADWGLVRKYGQTTIVRTLPGHPLGTLAFASPEIWDDAHSVTAASDVYSLGCIIGWCLTGIWPKPNIAPLISGLWEEMVTRMTEFTPQLRLPDMDSVLVYLENIGIKKDDYHQEETSNQNFTSYDQSLSHEEYFDMIRPRNQTHLDQFTAKFLIKEHARNLIYALSKKNITYIKDFTHPLKGLRFTPYTYVSNKDVVITKDDFEIFFQTNKVLYWGIADGTGYSIVMGVEQYFDRYVYDDDFINADQVFYNDEIERGNMKNNAFSFYPNSIIVEYHIIGSDPDSVGMDWRSLKLVFEQHETQWLLVGIIHDQWTT